MSDNPYIKLAINILIGIAILAILAGFLFFKQYLLAAVIIIFGIIGIMWSQFLTYADARARENTALTARQQADFNIMTNNLLNRIQTGDAHSAHVLNSPEQPPQEPVFRTANIGTAEDVPLVRVTK